MYTLKSPFVSVPVLSKHIVFTLCEFSKASLVFISIPLVLAFPEEITIARGVASPKLHGHATNNTLIKIFNENVRSFETIIQTTKAIIAITKTIGTKYELILSAILAIGAFVDVAFATNLTISETVESFPIFTALYFIVPS